MWLVGVRGGSCVLLVWLLGGGWLLFVLLEVLFVVVEGCLVGCGGMVVAFVSFVCVWSLVFPVGSF